MPDFVQRGRQLLEQGQFQEAVKICRLGLLGSPAELEGRLVLGTALLALRRYDEVLAEMRVALELDGGTAWGLSLKGEALLRKGDAAQACDVLTRAMAVAPDDGRIRDLYGEARRQRGASSPPDPMAGRAFPLGARRGTVGPETTGASSVGGTETGTMELDPATEVAGFAHGAEHELKLGDSTGHIELSSADILPAEDPTSAGRPAALAGHDRGEAAFARTMSPDGPPPAAPAPAAVALAPAAVAAPSVERGAPIRTLFGQPAGPAPAAPRPGRARPGGSSGPFEETLAGDGRGVKLAASRGPFDDVPTRVGGVADLPGADDDEPEPRPWRALEPARPALVAPPLDEMFPDDDDGGVSKMVRLDPPSPSGVAEASRRTTAGDLAARAPAAFDGEAPLTSAEDMRTIREGLGLPGEGTNPGRHLPREILERERAEARRLADERRQRVTAGFATVGPRTTGPLDVVALGTTGPVEVVSAPRPSAASTAVPEPVAAARPRRGLAVLGYLVLAAAVAGAGVFAGFRVRALRLDRQIARARAAAAAQVATDTYPATVAGRDALARIVRVRDTPSERDALARLSARLVAEFGDAAAAATATPVGQGADAHAARGYLALAGGDAAAATAAAAALAGVAPEDPDVDYLRGRAALLAGRTDEATEALRRAVGRGGHPLTYVALARAEAAGGRLPEALAALDRARGGAPDHPAATIWTALILARAASLPAVAGDPEASLQALLDDPTRASPTEQAWAALALGEVALARGERERARVALGRAAAAAPTDPTFERILADALLRAGDAVAARALVDRLLARDPGGVDARLLAARVALSGGDAGVALAALASVGDLSGRPDALALRGRARLATGALGPAAEDLDAALDRTPDAIEAIVARAEVDLARGDAGAARRRLEPRYKASPGLAALAIAYAAALREDGDPSGARAILEPLAASPPSYPLSLERGRLALQGGDLAGARRAFEEARELDRAALGARLELARLALETGDAATHRTLLDGLVTDLPESGAVLVEAARAHSLVGDLDGAAALVERAAGAGAPAWTVARERGRLRLRRLDAAGAAAELGKAKLDKLDDPETHLLALEAALLARGKAGAQHAVEDAAKGLRGSPVVALARGIAALLEERTAVAIGEFERATTQLAAARATPRELGRAQYWLGRAYYLQGVVGKASAWLGKAVASDPSNADAYFFLGQLAFEREDTARMVAAYERSVALDPSGNPPAWFFLAEHYARGKDAERARAACDAYLTRWPEGDFAEPLRTLRGKLP